MTSRRRRGATLLDALVAGALLSVTATTMSVAYQTATTQTRKAEIRSAVVARLNSHLDGVLLLARQGSLQATSDVLSNETLRGLAVRYEVAVDVDGSVARGDVFLVTGTATWTDGRNERVRFETRVVRRPTMGRVGVKFTNAATPALASISSAGFFIQHRWNFLSTATGAEPLLNGTGTASPIRVSVTGGTLAPTGGPYVVGVPVQIPAIYDSGFTDSGSGRITATVTGIPYARYDLVVYFNFSTGPAASGGFFEMDALRVPITPIDRNNLWASSFRLVQGTNMMVLPNLTGSTKTFRTVGTPAPVIHAVQVVERP